MQTLGQRLRTEREKLGLSIPELARRTRIRALFFEAIEEDKPEQFPGRFFYRSFLRQYVEILGLPESLVQSELERSNMEELVENVERTATAQNFKPEVPPLPTGQTNVREETRRWMIRLSALLGVLVLCSGVYFFWQRWGQRWFDDGWRAVTTRPAQPVAQPRPPAPPAEPPLKAAQSPAPAVVADGTAAQNANGATPPNTPQETAVQKAAGQSEAKVDAPPAGVAARGKIEIRATGICWIGGWRDGKLFVSSTLHAGDVRVVEGGGVLRLQFGSSGDVAITVDGNALQPIGAKGEPRTLEYRDGAYRLLNRVSNGEAKPQ